MRPSSARGSRARDACSGLWAPPAPVTTRGAHEVHTRCTRGAHEMHTPLSPSLCCSGACGPHPSVQPVYLSQHLSQPRRLLPAVRRAGGTSICLVSVKASADRSSPRDTQRTAPQRFVRGTGASARGGSRGLTGGGRRGGGGGGRRWEEEGQAGRRQQHGGGGGSTEAAATWRGKVSPLIQTSTRSRARKGSLHTEAVWPPELR